MGRPRSNAVPTHRIEKFRQFRADLPFAEPNVIKTFLSGNSDTYAVVLCELTGLGRVIRQHFVNESLEVARTPLRGVVNTNSISNQAHLVNIMH